MSNKNKLTFSSAEDSEKTNRQILKAAGSSKHLAKYGIAGGKISPEELIAVRNKIYRSNLAVEKWIHEEMIAAGINPNDRSSYNKEKVKFLKKVLKEKWNQRKGKTYINRPKEVQELNKILKKEHTWGSRFLNLVFGAGKVIGGPGGDFRQKLLVSSYEGKGPYDFLNETNNLLGKINTVNKTRYQKNVNTKALSDLGMFLSFDYTKEVNPYYSSDTDTYQTKAHNKETAKAQKRWNRNPILRDINPGGWRFNVSEDNPNFVNETPNGQPSHLNYQKPNTKRNSLTSDYTGPSGFEWAGGYVEGYSPPNKRWSLMTKPERTAAKRRGLSIADFD